MTEQWSEECEELLAEWSEKASCYRWLHGRCEKKYKRKYYRFSIPVIILSTLTGAANVGMDSFVPPENKAMASAIVGGVNIFAGILSTLQNFLKVAELMEAHRSSGVAWSKLGRNIAIELALDHSKRAIQNDFLKIARAEYDRLIESSPMIDDDIIAQFQSKFKNHKIKMSVPAICNGFDKCDIYRIDDAVQRHKDDFFDGIDDLISNEEKEIIEKLKDKINNKDIYQKVNEEVEKRVSVEFDKRVSQELDKRVNQEFDTKVIEEVSKQSEEIKKQLGEKVVDEETGFLDGIEDEAIPVDKKDNIIK
tara:strand:+ start:9 stop:929 length:921 start_codon:yes stop_codon:yes gene_type:complete